MKQWSLLREQVLAIGQLFTDLFSAVNVRESTSLQSSPIICAQRTHDYDGNLRFYMFNVSSVPFKRPIPEKDITIVQSTRSTIFSAMHLIESIYQIVLRVRDVPFILACKPIVVVQNRYLYPRRWLTLLPSVADVTKVGWERFKISPQSTLIFAL